MDCYFGSYDLPQENALDKSAVVTFHIPDIGIKFKAPFAAVDQDHSHLAALLALLEFIDSNRKHLSNRNYQIFGTNRRVINGVNRQEAMDVKFTELLARTQMYREKFHFSLRWVAADRNQAYDPLAT